MSKIAVDIDSTLYDFVSLSRGLMGGLGHGNERLMNAAYAEWSEWRTPMDIAGDRWPHIVDLCHAPDVILAQEPFPGAVDVLNELAENHEIVYASNRDPSTQDPTRRWLLSSGFPEGEVLCHHNDKLLMVQDCQYLIDDRPKTLVGFIGEPTWFEWYPARPRKAFGLVYPYNRALTDVPGIYLAPSWPLLGTYLRGKTVP